LEANINIRQARRSICTLPHRAQKSALAGRRDYRNRAFSAEDEVEKGQVQFSAPPRQCAAEQGSPILFDELKIEGMKHSHFVEESLGRTAVAVKELRQSLLEQRDKNSNK
jgi:hypothetical protein